MALGICQNCYGANYENTGDILKRDENWCELQKTIFKATDYALSRAGANTIVELLSNNILTTFIPLPKNNSRGDQVENAKYLKSLGVANVIFQNELTFKKLQNELILLENQAKNIKNNIISQNFADGTKKIIDIILANKKD